MTNKLHAVIVSSPSLELRHEKALSLAATALCIDPTADGDACQECRHCKKIFSGVHPDVNVIERQLDSGGKPRRELVVDQMRSLIADAQIMPNEAEGKVYIIQDADTMNTSAQNAVLKLLEEPPRGVMFIMCLGDAGRMLPTIRSRCGEININAQEEPDSAEAIALAREFINLAIDNKPTELLRFFAANEKLETIQMREFVGAAINEASRLLIENNGSREQMMKILKTAQKAREYLKYNVSVKHTLGMLCVCEY